MWALWGVLSGERIKGLNTSASVPGLPAWQSLLHHHPHLPAHSPRRWLSCGHAPYLCLAGRGPWRQNLQQSSKSVKQCTYYTGLLHQHVFTCLFWIHEGFFTFYLLKKYFNSYHAELVLKSPLSVVFALLGKSCYLCPCGSCSMTGLVLGILRL